LTVTQGNSLTTTQVGVMSNAQISALQTLIG
jgi:hypothetical protein